jgi:hypothetical protein
MATNNMSLILKSPKCPPHRPHPSQTAHSPMSYVKVNRFMVYCDPVVFARPLLEESQSKYSFNDDTNCQERAGGNGSLHCLADFRPGRCHRSTHHRRPALLTMISRTIGFIIPGNLIGE